MVENDSPLDEDGVVSVVGHVDDPEIPLGVVNLGLLYDVQVEDGRSVDVDGTLNSLGCPAEGRLRDELEQNVLEIGGVREASPTLVRDPPWSVEQMMDAGPARPRRTSRTCLRRRDQFIHELCRSMPASLCGGGGAVATEYLAAVPRSLSPSPAWVVTVLAYTSASRSASRTTLYRGHRVSGAAGKGPSGSLLPLYRTSVK